MVRFGWRRLIFVSLALIAVLAPFGETGVSVAFMIIGIASVVSVVQATRAYQPSHPRVWYIFAASQTLFLIGGIADLFTPLTPDGGTVYPGWREPFDFVAYAGFVVGCTAMARARLAHREGALHLVLELPHVARPGVGDEQVLRGRRETALLLAIPLAVQLQEVIDQGQDVCATLT